MVRFFFLVKHNLQSSASSSGRRRDAAYFVQIRVCLFFVFQSSFDPTKSFSSGQREVLAPTLREHHCVGDLRGADDCAANLGSVHGHEPSAFFKVRPSAGQPFSPGGDLPKSSMDLPPDAGSTERLAHLVEGTKLRMI